MPPHVPSKRQADRRADCYRCRTSFPARRGPGRVRWSEKPVRRNRLPAPARVMSITERYARRNNDVLKSCKKRPAADLSIALEPDLQDPGRDCFGTEPLQSCSVEFLFGQFCRWKGPPESFRSTPGVNPPRADNTQALCQAARVTDKRLPYNGSHRLHFVRCHSV